MKLLTLLGAALVAAAPAPALASEAPAYAKAFAIHACTYKLAGKAEDDARVNALRAIWPKYGAAIMAVGSHQAARWMTAERMALCGGWQ